MCIRDRYRGKTPLFFEEGIDCLLYTSDAADDLLCVDLGGRRIIKKKTECTVFFETVTMIAEITAIIENT